MAQRDGAPLPGRRHPHRLPPELYQHPLQPVFVTVCSRWSGSLAQQPIAAAIVEAMGRMGRRFGVRVHAYCVMPEHVHVVASVTEGGGDLRKWLRYAKSESARTAGVGPLWQRSYWDCHARRDQDVAAAVDYILYNPVRRGLCEHWQQWPHSWSEWDEGGQGPDPNVT